MDEPKVAIIIPAYNAGKMLGKSLESVLAQTYRNIDVWVTDDGSKDDTGVVADRFAAKDARVRVIHQENCGCYQARLNALKRIDAPYFGFADADDTLEPDMIERMMEAMLTNRLDAVECLAYGEKRADGSLRIVDAAEMPRYKFDYLVNPNKACFVWNKLYRNQFDFEQFELTDRNTNFEDLIFNLQFFRKIKRLGLLNVGLYHYEEVAGSAVHAFGPRQRHDLLWMLRHHFSMSLLLFEENRPNVIQIWFGHLVWSFRNLKNALITIVRYNLSSVNK